MRSKLVLAVGLVAGLGLVAAAQPSDDPQPAWWYPGPAGYSEGEDGPFEIDLDLGLGFIPPLSRAAANVATADLTPGLLIENLLHRIYVYRRLHERLVLDIDYDSSRRDGGPFDAANYYSLEYRGLPGEFVGQAALGNRVLSIPGDRYVDTAGSSNRSLAAVAAGTRATARGTTTAAAAVRTSGADTARLHFVGSRQVFESTILDVDHERHRHFFVPDPVDPGTLKVYASTPGAGDLFLDGLSYQRMTEPRDFEFDSSRSWLHLRASVRDRNLAVTYESGGFSAGATSLGRSSFIRPDGLRENFSEDTHPEYFREAAGTRYLLVNQVGVNSYWEHRGVYYLQDLRGYTGTELLETEVVLTGTTERNANYDSVLASAIVDTDQGLLIFAPEDTVGFYPRPFPGLLPYTNPDGANPFDPGNPVYGNLGRARLDASVNTIRLGFRTEANGYVIDDLFADGSVVVFVDGDRLAEDRFTVDPATGEVSIAAGAAGPASRVTIEYQRLVSEFELNRLQAEVSVDWENDRYRVHGMAQLEAPLQRDAVPGLGEEQLFQVTGSLEAGYGRTSEDGSQFRASVHGAANLVNANVSGAALIASMEEDVVRTIALADSGWQLATASSLLPSLSPPVGLERRGDLLYRNFTDDSVIGGGLRTIDWDNPANIAFEYDAKAGPYNTSDGPPGGDPLSLVLDYRFESLAENQFVSVVRAIGDALDRFDTLEVVARGRSSGGPPVRLYLELVQDLNEDLDADGQIDGEVNVSSPGFPITPSDGGRTVIGSDRYGDSDGDIDSEDLNGNGLLDPRPGLTETGVVLGEPFVAEFSGDGEWATVRLDLRPAREVDPGVFQRASALRLTVVPSSTPTVPLSGQLLLNSIRFSDSGVGTTSDNRLAIRTTPNEAVPADPPATAPGPEQGSSQVLEVTLLPPLPEGDRTAVTTALGVSRDLSRYEYAGLSVFVTNPAVLPAGLVLDVRFTTTASDYLDATVLPVDLSPGWNEILVQTAAPQVVTVNGSPAGNLEATGRYASLSSVATMELGMRATGGDLTNPFTVWTDSWHVRGTRVRPGLAAGASVESFYAGDIVAGRTTLVSDPRFLLEYTYRDLEPAGSARHRAAVQGSAVLASWFPVTVDSRLHADSLDAGDPVGSVTGTVGLQTGHPALPQLEHLYTYAGSVETSLGLEGSSYVQAETITREATARIDQTVDVPGRVTQGLAVFRTVSERNIADGVSGSLTLGTPQSTGWSAKADTAFARRFSGEGLRYLGGPLSTYAGLITNVLESPESTFESGHLAATDHDAEVGLAPNPDRRVGVRFSATEHVAERNIRPDRSARDIAAGAAVRLAASIAVGPSSSLTVRPSFERSVSSSVGLAPPELSQWQVVGWSGLTGLAPPLWFLAPDPFGGRHRERDAAVALREDLSAFGAGAARLASELGLETRMSTAAWYLPSLIGISVAGATDARAASISQTRSISARVNKSMPIVDPGRGVGSLVFAGAGQYSRDYALDTEKLSVTASLYWAFSSNTGRSWQVNQNTGWTHERQSPNESLLLFPEDPSLEPVPPFTSGSDRLTNLSSLQYTWQVDRVPTSPSRLVRRFGITDTTQQVVNRERVAVETSTTLADPASLGTVVQLPLRITLNHETDVNSGENLSFRLSLKAQGGIEKVVTAGIEDRVPAFGIEAHVGATIRY